jgi:hypothetical protein
VRRHWRYQLEIYSLLDPDTPSPQGEWQPGASILEADYVNRCLALSFLAAFTLRTRLAMLNKRNAKYMAELPDKEKKQLEETTEIWDSDPRYVFMT